MERSDRAGFLIKTQDHSVNFKNVPFLEVFRLFLEKFTNDFRFFADNVRTHCWLAACEDRTSGKNPVLEIIIQKVHIWVKSGVQRSSYISRTVNAIENLI